MLRRSLFWCIAFVLVAAMVAADSPAVVDLKAKLQGHWDWQSKTGNNSKHRVEKALDIDGDNLKFTTANSTFKESVTITMLDPAQSPMAIDINAKGDIVRGILEIKGDTLRIAFDAKGAGRPTAFDAPGVRTDTYKLAKTTSQPAASQPAVTGK